MVANLAAICSWPNKEFFLLTQQQHIRVTNQMTAPESDDVCRPAQFCITAEFCVTG